MTKFNVGDKVRIIMVPATYRGVVTSGMEVTVIKVFEEVDLYETDAKDSDAPWRGIRFYGNEIEKVEEIITIPVSDLPVVMSYMTGSTRNLYTNTSSTIVVLGADLNGKADYLLAMAHSYLALHREVEKMVSETNPDAEKIAKVKDVIPNVSEETAKKIVEALKND